MSNLYLSGSILMEGRSHSVEYDQGGLQSATLFLRLRKSDSKTAIPIFVEDIDSVIEMLVRGRSAIAAIEGDLDSSEK